MLWSKDYYWFFKTQFLLWILWKFHILYPNSNNLPAPPYPLLSSVVTSKRKLNDIKQSKQIQEQIKTKNPFRFSIFLPLQHIFICHVGLGSSVSQSTPFCPVSFPSICSLQWVTGLVQGFWFLVHHHHGTLTEIPLGYPTAVHVMEILLVSFHRNSPSQAPAGWVDVRVSQSKTQLWAWVIAELVSLDHWGHLPQVRVGS